MSDFLSSAYVPDARAWLAETIEASAVAAADDLIAGLGDVLVGDRTRNRLTKHIEEHGLVPLLAWVDAVTVAGFDHEPWAREAAMRAVRTYADRVGELMTATQVGAAPNEARQ